METFLADLIRDSNVDNADSRTGPLRCESDWQSERCWLPSPGCCWPARRCCPVSRPAPAASSRTRGRCAGTGRTPVPALLWPPPACWSSLTVPASPASTSPISTLRHQPGMEQLTAREKLAIFYFMWLSQWLTHRGITKEILGTRKRHDDWTGAGTAGGTELRAVSGLSAAISCQLSGHFLHLYHLSTSTFPFKLCLHIKLGLVSVIS